MNFHGLVYGLVRVNYMNFSSNQASYTQIQCLIGPSTPGTPRTQVLGPIVAKFMEINPFPPTDLALWVTTMGTLGTLSEHDWKLSGVMLDVCGNVYLH